MYATKLKGLITRDRRLVIEIPRDIAPGAVEVILLQLPSVQPTRRRPRRGSAHPAFGIWAKRTDIVDSVAYAAHLRERVGTRADGNTRD